MSSHSKMLKPYSVNTRGVVAFVSPSAPHAGIFQNRTHRGVQWFENNGFKIKMGKNALLVTGDTAGSAIQRVNDIMEFVDDDQVGIIMATIGGTRCSDILDHLDYAKIRRNRKIFVGYSDITKLLIAIYIKSGLVNFYGPSLVSEFSEFPNPCKFTLKNFFPLLREEMEIIDLDCSDEWTDDYIDWKEEKLAIANVGRNFQKNEGWSWLVSGCSEGVLLGGCMESLVELLGTNYWPNWTEKLIFIELAEVERADEVFRLSMLQLKKAGVFESIRGLVLGRFCRQLPEKIKSLHDFTKDLLSNYNIPILVDVDFGHTDPKLTIPIGVKAMLDSTTNSFTLLESCVEDFRIN